ncbi:MAG: DMT family transporter [Nocardioidaceae bacterium]
MSVGWLLLVQYAVAAAALFTVRMARRGGSALLGGGFGTSAVAVGVVGLTGTIFLQYLAFVTAPIVAANVLAYAWPLLAALWVALTFRTRRAVVLAGLALVGFGGVALIFASPGAATDGAAAGDAGWGYAAALGSAACMAIYTVASSRMQVAATDLLVPATLIGVLAAGVLTAFTPGPWPQASGWIAAAYIGLGPMAGGYGLWTLALAGEAPNASRPSATPHRCCPPSSCSPPAHPPPPPPWPASDWCCSAVWAFSWHSAARSKRGPRMRRKESTTRARSTARKELNAGDSSHDHVRRA